MAAMTPTPACPQATRLIDAGLQVLVPTDPDYSAREASYFSHTAKLRPACIVRPRSAGEVSAALKLLVGAGEKFAVRSGGHGVRADANNIDGGVTVDLGLLCGTVLSDDARTATIGSGARWRDVYQTLARHGLVVVGAREGSVGVGGFLLGGGYSWFAGRRGWACDNVIAYEVVLADGRVVTADRDTHADLFRALRGGSNNFGVVTSFTMETMPCDRVWGGVTATPKEATPDAVGVTCKFTENLEKYPDSNLIVVVGYFPQFGDNVVSTAVLQTEGDENSPAYEDWRKLPKIMDLTKPTTIFDMSIDMTLPHGYYDVWFTLCFKNDERILTKATQVHQELVDALQSEVADGDFVTNCIFMPVPAFFGRDSVARGGNMFGIERNADNCILLQLAAMVRTLEQHAFAYSKVRAAIAAVRECAAALGGDREWLYMNYADKTQDVLASYGPENVRRMKEVAARYDPGRVFQKLCPGGWKISDVE